MSEVPVITQTFTHNHIKTFEDCPYKYYLEYVRKLYWPDLEANYEFGLSIHKLLDYQARGLNVEHLVRNASEEIKECWKILDQAEITKLEVVESEWAFCVRLPETSYWLEGRIDRLCYDKKNGKYIVVDFKTGQKLPSLRKNDWQSTVYLYCVSSAKKIPPEKIYFLYYKPDTPPETRIIEFDEHQKNLYQYNLINLLNKLDSVKVWNKMADCMNKYCKYKIICS